MSHPETYDEPELYEIYDDFPEFEESYEIEFDPGTY